MKSAAGKSLLMPPSPGDALGPVDWRTDAQVFVSSEFQIEVTRWPSDPEEDDLNAMYLHLYGKSWGNSDETVKYLKNTKTLAITTQADRAGSVSKQPEVVMLMHPDGRFQNPGKLTNELIANAGNITALL